LLFVQKEGGNFLKNSKLNWKKVQNIYWNHFSKRMSYLLSKLKTKEEIDEAIIGTEDLVLVLRFGKDSDSNCLHTDDILAKSSFQLAKKWQEFF